MIPSTIHPSVRSAAERKLFAVIRDAPGTTDWVCLHSLGIARHGTKRRAEIDFVLLTCQGVFVLEVKGGRISREGGVWRFTDRYGVAHRKHESPFDQASSAMFALEESIRQRFHDDARRSHLLYGFGVMFPDVPFESTGSEADPRQVYDARDRRQSITQFVDRLAAYWRERGPPNRNAPSLEDIDALADFLRGDFDLVPPLGLQADVAVAQLLSLEREQYAVLDALERWPRPRVLVQGAAGTGKTLLALEAARREARDGGEGVLLLCYNRLLSGLLDAEAEPERAHGGRIVTRSIYGLLNGLIGASSLADEFRAKCRSVDQTTVYRTLYPEYASLALAEEGVRPFRTLIVDEAQDMMTQELVDVLDAYVEGGFEAGRWWVFCDVNNQAAVFGAFEEAALFRLMEFGQVVVLPTNRRNTRPIADETAMLSRPKVRAVSTVDGVPVRYGWYDRRDLQPSLLARTLKGMLSDGVAPSRITVLSPRKAEDCCAWSVAEPRLVQMTEHNMRAVLTGACDSITFCSVPTFKGLENDFIVLTDIEDLDSGWWQSVIYVGMSRARFGLHLLLDRSLQPTYEQRLRLWLEEHHDAVSTA